MEGRGRQSAVCDVSLIKLCRAAPRLCALDLTGVGVGGLWAGSLGTAGEEQGGPASRGGVLGFSPSCRRRLLPASLRPCGLSPHVPPHPSPPLLTPPHLTPTPGEWGPHRHLSRLQLFLMGCVLGAPLDSWSLGFGGVSR